MADVHLNQVLRLEQHIYDGFIGHDIVVKLKMVLLELGVGTNNVGPGKMVPAVRTNGMKNKVA